MQACVLQKPAKIETNPLVYSEVPKPEPAPGELLVRVKYCGVCRTDLHVIEGELPQRKSPIIPGHQVVGTVEKLGERLAAGALTFAIGTRVGIAWLHHTDGTCQFCRSGGRKIFATIPCSRATPSMAATRDILSRRKILSTPFRSNFPT